MTVFNHLASPAFTSDIAHGEGIFGPVSLPHMPYLEQTADPVIMPDCYPDPDWDGIGTVARVSFPAGGDDAVGWIVRQGDARIAWMSLMPPAVLTGSDSESMANPLQKHYAEGRTVPEAWHAVLEVSEHEVPEDVELLTFIEDVRKAWGLA